MENIIIDALKGETLSIWILFESFLIWFPKVDFRMFVAF